MVAESHSDLSVIAPNNACATAFPLLLDHQIELARNCGSTFNRNSCPVLRQITNNTIKQRTTAVEGDLTAEVCPTTRERAALLHCSLPLAQRITATATGSKHGASVQQGRRFFAAPMTLGARTSTGQASGEPDGAGWMGALHPDDVAHTIEAFSVGLASGDPIDVDYRIRVAATGDYRWMRAHAYPRRSTGGSISRWYGVVEDTRAGGGPAGRGEPSHGVALAAALCRRGVAQPPCPLHQRRPPAHRSDRQGRRAWVVRRDLTRRHDPDRTGAAARDAARAQRACRAVVSARDLGSDRLGPSTALMPVEG